VKCIILIELGFFDRLLQKTPMFIFTKICTLEEELIHRARRTEEHDEVIKYFKRLMPIQLEIFNMLPAKANSV